MDDSNDSLHPAKRPKRTDENGQHYDKGNGSGSSQTKRFARCTRNKFLCEVCSKPDCGKCPNCLLNRASEHQACRNKPKEKCLSYIKMGKSSKETTQTYALATTTKHVSRGNTNGDLASSDTAISEDKEESDTDPQFILKHVSSQLSSLSFNFSHEINKLKDIVDNALQVYTESSTLLSRVSSTPTCAIASVTSISPSHRGISQSAASTSFLCVTSIASDVHQKDTVFRSSNTDVRHMSVSVVSQHQNTLYTNAPTAKCIPTSSAPVLTSSIAVLASSTTNSTSAGTKSVPESTVSVSTITENVSASTIAGPASLSTGTTTTTSSRLISGYSGEKPVSSSLNSGSIGTKSISNIISSRKNSVSTDSYSASTSTGFTASTGFSMPISSSSQSTYAMSVTGPVATSTVVCASTISRPFPVFSGSRSHSGFTSSGPVQFSSTAPCVTLSWHTTQPIQSQSPALQHFPLQASLTQIPAPTATVSLASPTAFRAMSSSSADQFLPSTSAIDPVWNLSPTVEDSVEKRVMKVMKEAFSTLKLDLHITKCGISGPPGTGKTHIKALLLNKDRPTQRSSTALSTKAKEVTNVEFPINSKEILKGGLQWTVLKNNHWARLLANTIYDSTPPVDSSNQNSSRVGRHVETTSALRFRGVSGMTYKLLLEMYKKNKPKRKRSTINKIHLIYFVDTGGQPQFQEILPNFVRSSINFLVHKLSEKLDDCPGFEYCLNGSKYTIPEALRVSNMYIITQSVRSVCSSIRSEDNQQSPEVAILGTFKDELRAQCEVNNEKYIKDRGIFIEKELCKYNYVGEGARKCTLMKHTRDGCIFPVDASEEGWNSNSKVIEDLRNKVHNCSNRVKDKPLSYFVFWQNLKDFSKKQKKPVLDKCTIQKIIDEQDYISLDATQVEEALDLFAEVNLILHFPSSSILKNLIFVDPNFIYERVTEIIVASFHCFGSSAIDNFSSTGIFTDLDLDTIPSLSFTKYHPTFTRQIFLSLLQDLFIIAELQEGHYFMPCVLKLENLESLSSESKTAIDEFLKYMYFHEVSGPLVFSFGDKMSPRGLFCAMVAKLSRNFGWKLHDGPNAVRCRNMIEFKVYNNENNVSLGTALLCDKLTHLEVYTTCERIHCCIIRKAILSSLFAAGSSLKYSFTAIDIHAGFYCKCPAVPKHHTKVFQKENSDMWQEKCSLNTRKHAVDLHKIQDAWFKSIPSPVSRDGSVPSIHQVIKELITNTVKWFDMAVYLEIDLAEVENIRLNKDDEKQRFTAVVEKWQKNGRPPFTWSTVVEVLDSQIVQEHYLANIIREKYLM